MDDTSEDDFGELLTPEQASEFLHVPVTTLAAWRSKNSGSGPPFRKHGRRVVYSTADLRIWSNARRRP